MTAVSTVAEDAAAAIAAWDARGASRSDIDRAHEVLFGPLMAGPSREARLVAKRGVAFGLFQVRKALTADSCVDYASASLRAGADPGATLRALQLFAELDSVRDLVTS